MTDLMGDLITGAAGQETAGKKAHPKKVRVSESSGNSARYTQAAPEGRRKR